MDHLGDAVDALAAETGFSGVVRVDRGDDIVFARAYGFSVRGWDLPNTVDTRFGLASGAKGLTALTVMSLVEDGVLTRATTARSLLGDDLPLVDEGVTVEHLLAHRSGIGDFADEEADGELEDYALTVAPHRLVGTEDYLEVLDGFPTRFAPGTAFAYNNGGFVVLALLAERASGVPFAELVAERVCRPAGMVDTAFLRSDTLPGRTALGYVTIDGVDRTNVFHLPMVGSGDGGIFSTVADVAALWRAFLGGRIVSPDVVREMTRPHSETADGSRSYGLGFWVRPERGSVFLEGCDAGVSFRSVVAPGDGIVQTVVSNSTDGAWPLTRLLDERLGT